MAKVHLGCGTIRLQGFINIDIEPSNKPDIIGDFRTMSFSELEEIRSHHLLEHFNRDEAIDVLKLWHSWLKKDGLLIVEVPDFEGICEKFLSDKYWMVRHTFGSQEADWAFHKDGWWEDKFKKIFPEVGFEILEIEKTTSRVIRKSGEDKGRHILPNIKVIAKKNV